MIMKVYINHLWLVLNIKETTLVLSPATQPPHKLPYKQLYFRAERVETIFQGQRARLWTWFLPRIYLTSLPKRDNHKGPER